MTPLGGFNAGPGPNEKWTTPTILDRLYELVGRDIEIQPNGLGNLVVHKAGMGAPSIGYLDLATDCFVWWDEGYEDVYLGEGA